MDDLDGFEFQHLCAIIFQTLGYGQVEEQALTGDGGKDIIIRSSVGKTVVECKHQPNTSLGRPVIQKLHSAVISEGAYRGIVITSGGFSKQAIEHAKVLKPSIELIDIAMLRDLASRAGIQLILGQEAAPIRMFRPLNSQEVNQLVISHLANSIISKPNPIANVYSSRSVNKSLRPVYQIDYEINANFTTSVGTVHVENSIGKFFVDGNDGSILPEGLAQYFNQAPRESIRQWGDIPAQERPRNVPFKIPASTIKEKAMQDIIRRHTKTVHYRGRNNQSYSKVCTPSKNDIFIDDISQMYFPEYMVEYSLGMRNQLIRLANNGALSSLVMDDSTATCRFCNGLVIQGSRSLCNECGQVSCLKKTILKTNRHSLQCDVCGKTLCRSCALYIRNLIFFKKVLCGNCADELARRGKQIEKLIETTKMQSK